MNILDKKMLTPILIVAAVLLLFGGTVITRGIRRRRSSEKYQLKQEGKITRIEDRQERAQIENKMTALELFDPKIVGNYPESYQLSEEAVTDLAKDLRGSVRWGLSPSKANAIFAGMKHKVQVAQLASVYNARYGRDMRTDIVKHLNNKNLVSLYKIIEQIPE
jgi:hypothetical protein